MTTTTNAGVLESFLAGDSARSDSLLVRHQRPAANLPAVPTLVSYDTEIAYATPEIVYVNPTRYSVTTSKQRNQLIAKLGARYPLADTELEVIGPKAPYEPRRYVTTTFHAYKRS